MIENLPGYINWSFAIVAILTVIFYLYAVWETGRQKIFLLRTTGVMLFLLVLHAVLAFNGFYLVKTIPPRFFLGLFPTIVILLFLFYFPAGKAVTNKTLQILTLLSVIRVFIEIILWWLSKEGQVPELMTFEGRNLDILSGLTAPLVAWLGFRGGQINRPLLILWNF